MQTANAAAQIDTYIYVVAVPNPIGINQQVSLQFFLANVPPAQYPLERPRFGYWYDISITITKPDGSIEAIQNLQTGEAAAGYTFYTPNQLGKYKIQADFPGQTITTGPSTDDYYKPSRSSIAEFTVQNQPIEEIPEFPLPTNYWTTPIEGENRAWSALSGNWLGGERMTSSGSFYNPYSTGPSTAHILWNKQQIFGGLVGGEFGGAIYNQGRWPSSNGYFGPPIIISGVLYVNEPRYYDNTPAGFKAIDLFTGETIWTNHVADSLSIGQVYQFHSSMTSMMATYLWSTSPLASAGNVNQSSAAVGSTWRAYDPLTGENMLIVTDVPAGGTISVGPSGELLVYYLGGNKNWLAMWNSTLWFYSTMSSAFGPQYAPNNVWAPTPGAYKWSSGLQWNVTTPSLGSQSITKVVSNDIIIATTKYSGTSASPYITWQMVCYNIKPGIYSGNGSGQQASVLWGPMNRTVFGIVAGTDDHGTFGDAEDGIFVIYDREELQAVAYDMYTGQQLWVSQPYDSAFAQFTGQVLNFVIAQGKVFSGGYDGCIYAFDARTGERLWKWYAGSSGFETPYESWPVEGSYVTFKIADGKLYAAAMEHSPSYNTWRFGKVWCVDINNGELVWSVLGSKLETCPSAIAYGVFVYMNQYDGKMYAFGKGPSKTTVVASAGTGNTITIQGTVTDTSAGAKELLEDSLFNIIPAVSDESQSGWMEYLYMQKPKPTNATGVQVKLSVIDQNGNSIDLGTTTTNIDGKYGISWTPTTQGAYQVVAEFETTGSYWGSQDSTYISVGETAAVITPTVAPTATVTPPSTVAPTTTVSASPTVALTPGTGISTETLLIAGAAAVIIIAVIAAALVLRKRK